MFLKKLNNEEKNAFLFFAEKVMKADGKISEQEIELMLSFKEEMKITNTENAYTEEDAYSVLQDSNNTVKRIVYLELLSLSFIDQNFDKQEVKCMLELKNKLGIPKEFTKKTEKWLKEYMDLVGRGCDIVEGI